MKLASYILALAMVATMIGTAVTRSIIHRRRERLHEIGGTQDIAMIGTAIALALGIAAFICMLAARHN